VSSVVKPKNPNALLIAFRKYHTWLGVVMSLFVLLIATTGIYLNHKDLFKPNKEEKPPPEIAGKEPPTGDGSTLTTTTDLNQLPVTFADAQAAYRDKYGEQPIERIELKNEKGRLVYKVKAASGELVVDAQSGTSASKKGSDNKEKKPAERAEASVARGGPDKENEKNGIE